MKTILHLAPIFHEKLWGGDRLRRVFGYDTPSDRTGEVWAVSGHPNGDCRVTNPEYGGATLGQLWAQHRELFGNMPGDTYPLLVKIIDAHDDLSIQVHPNDDYARVHENGSLGKTECWYVLDCEPGTNIIIGHNARSKEEMARLISQGRWNDLLRQVPIHKGDFFQIEPGCLHAIRGGTLILETQQSSDVTYRFYDYDRLEHGRKRPLHLAQCMDVVTVPFVPAPFEPVTHTDGDATVTRLEHCSYFDVDRVCLHGRAELTFDAPFVNVSILSGRGTLDGCPVHCGEHMVLAGNYDRAVLEGELELIYSYV